jgi:hypothetical protein
MGFKEHLEQSTEVLDVRYCIQAADYQLGLEYSRR